MIISFNPDNKEHIEAAVKLHKELLGESPIVQLGDSFMKEFYYNCLVKDGLLLCELFYHENECVGFISFTNDPLKFMKRGLKNNFPKLCLIMFATIIKNPAIIKVIFNMASKMLNRSAATSGVEETAYGEILSFGLRKDVLKLEDAQTGKRTPHLLYEKAISYFAGQGLKKYRLAVMKENKEALLFYLSYGGKIIDDKYADGKSYQLEFAT